MASAAMLAPEIEADEPAEAEVHGIAETELAWLAFELWHLGSCAGLETEEESPDSPDAVACHASCL